MNPFIYETFATGDHFCGRKKELKTLINYFKNGKNVLLYSKRRFGKSSLIKEIFENQLPSNKYLTLYIDLFEITSENDFAKLAYQEAGRSIGLNFKNALKQLGGIFKRTKFTASINENGEINYSPIIMEKVFEELVEDFFTGIKKYADSKKINIVVAFDEFQQIALIKNKKIDAIIRKHIQSHNNISYIFSGSKKHMLTALFNKHNAPLYEMASGLEVLPIDLHDFYTFVSRHLNAKISQTSFEYLYELCRGESKLIQQLSYHLFEIAKNSNTQEIFHVEIDHVLSEILNQNNGELQLLFDQLSLPQKKALKAITLSDGKSIFSLNILSESNITKDSLSSAIKILAKSEIIDKENGDYYIINRKFELWCKKKLMSL